MTASTSLGLQRQSRTKHSSVQLKQPLFRHYVSKRTAHHINGLICTKRRRHKMTAVERTIYAMVAYDSWFLLLLRGSEGSHPPLLLQRCAAVPHDSQRQRWHGCKQEAGSGRPNLYLSSQWDAAFFRIVFNLAVFIGPPRRQYGVAARRSFTITPRRRAQGGKND